jgi:crotonobetainyl-CoA:carnitine CoA-transferase CaiB-like acyl-CoA transferase
MLSDIRVLELSSPSTMLAGQMLGDLGGDVILIESPHGSKGRRLGPYIDGVPGLERGLAWHALNRNKRGVTLDPATPDGRALLEQLIAKVDVVIEAIDGSSALEGLTLPHRLIHTKITAFSTRGPKSNYHATDLVLMAAGGAPAMAGDADRPPLFFPLPQAMMEAGAEAAVASLAALIARDRLDVGQVAEVQGRVATMQAALGRLVAGRSGGALSLRGAAMPMGAMPRVPGMYECADGWVTITVAFMPAFVAMTQRIAAWLQDEGRIGAEVAELDFMKTMQAIVRGETSPAPIEQFIAALQAQCLTQTKADIVQISNKHRFMAAPALNMKDIAEFEHFRVRGLFAEQEVGGRRVQVPAAFAQFSDYDIQVRRPAPSLSQHTGEVLRDDAGLSQTEIQALFEHGVI